MWRYITFQNEVDSDILKYMKAKLLSTPDKSQEYLEIMLLKAVSNLHFSQSIWYGILNRNATTRHF